MDRGNRSPGTCSCICNLSWFLHYVLFCFLVAVNWWLCSRCFYHHAMFCLILGPEITEAEMYGANIWTHEPKKVNPYYKQSFGYFSHSSKYVTKTNYIPIPAVLRALWSSKSLTGDSLIYRSGQNHPLSLPAVFTTHRLEAEVHIVNSRQALTNLPQHLSALMEHSGTSRCFQREVPR